MRRSLFILGAALAVSAFGCAHQSNVTLKTRSASAVASTSTISQGATSSTAGQTTTSTGISTTSTSAPTSTTVSADPLAAATPAITAALEAYGHNAAYAACVIQQVGEQFTGTQLKFAIAILSLVSPTDAQTQAAVAATGISDADKADMPDNLHAIADGCASTEHPNG